MLIKTWKIIADENIPFVRELFASFGDVYLLKGRDISTRDVQDADVLLVRSVTQVGQHLLNGSSVKFVGTCTIGIDHLQTDWLNANNVQWASAPGCNALGVVQYVLSCLAIHERLEQRNKIAIVGCGNVGERLYRTLKSLGNDCVCIDPFKTRDEVPDLGHFEDIYACDVLCLHTPLTKTGSHPTWHLFSAQVLQKLKPGALLINAGRGAVVDNQALLALLQKGQDLNVVLDVWEPEPDISVELLRRIALGTPHIAGYSYEGKVNGSLMIFDALCRFAALDEKQNIHLQDLKQNVLKLAFGEAQTLVADSATQAILATYDVRDDDQRLRAQVDKLPAAFDVLRKTYPVRREPGHYVLQGASIDAQRAMHLGFVDSINANLINTNS